MVTVVANQTRGPRKKNTLTENIASVITITTLRVCPKTSGGITKFSEHEAD